MAYLKFKFSITIHCRSELFKFSVELSFSWRTMKIWSTHFSPKWRGKVLELQCQVSHHLSLFHFLTNYLDNVTSHLFCTVHIHTICICKWCNNRVLLLLTSLSIPCLLYSPLCKSICMLFMVIFHFTTLDCLLIW